MISIGWLMAGEPKQKAAPKKTDAKVRKSPKWTGPDLDADQSAMRTKKTAKKK
jgi:hypothetical protein